MYVFPLHGSPPQNKKNTTTTRFHRNGDRLSTTRYTFAYFYFWKKILFLVFLSYHYYYFLYFFLKIFFCISHFYRYQLFAVEGVSFRRSSSTASGRPGQRQTRSSVERPSSNGWNWARARPKGAPASGWVFASRNCVHAVWLPDVHL